MATHPPFMNSTGLVSKIFDRLAEAQRPERFTQDYLGSVLGFSSGSARPFIPLMKRLGFLKADGTPTQLYARFRNPSERQLAMLEALKSGYPTLYARNEFAHALPRDKLREIVIEVTGLESASSALKAIVGTFESLKKAGNVDASTVASGATVTQSMGTVASTGTQLQKTELEQQRGQSIGMNLSYTINLNLPASPDPDVFNAIFRALKEHLLGR